jgi:hypothetical protein
MSDLSEYDRQIVEAAERFADSWKGIGYRESYDAVAAIQEAVARKREAQKPKCMHRIRVRVTDTEACGLPAIQRIIDDAEASVYDRCADHAVTVTAL